MQGRSILPIPLKKAILFDRDRADYKPNVVAEALG